MKRLKVRKKEIKLVKYLIIEISKYIRKKGLIIKDSNAYHFIIHQVNKKMNLGLSYGWFKHGPYSVAIDDVLIELKMMDKKQHQLYADEQALPINEWITKK